MGHRTGKEAWDLCKFPHGWVGFTKILLHPSPSKWICTGMDFSTTPEHSLFFNLGSRFGPHKPSADGLVSRGDGYKCIWICFRHDSFQVVNLGPENGTH